MPSPDFSFPDDFPDLTLPERADKAPSSPSPSPAPLPARPRWAVGDRVLAPWEPNFLYVGRVAGVGANQALIEFEDGDAGWVLLDSIRPLAVQRGQWVLSRRKMGPQFYPGEIREVRGDEVLIVFADGQGEEWTRIAALRIPCQVLGPGAEPVRIGSPREPVPALRPGNRVWAPWDKRLLYVGTVDQILDGEVHIDFDDDKRGWVQPQQVLPLHIPVGLRVEIWKTARDHLTDLGGRPNPLELDEPGKFRSGVVVEVSGDKLLIRYHEDGVQEWTTTAAVALPCEPCGPDARPTRVVPRSGGNVGRWVLFIAFGILLALLRAGCGAGFP
jgi:hypothetical protein